MDEVAVRQQLEWYGNRYRGYIDLETDTDDDSLPMAKRRNCFQGCWYKTIILKFLLGILDSWLSCNRKIRI